MKLEAMGPVHVDGGAVFVVSGAPPGRAVEWSLEGEGELLALSEWTDENGLASARYMPGAGADPAEVGDAVTVRARVHA